jgi:hypothetical protein
LLLSNGLAPSASAAPDPDTNKNAILLDLDCGGHSVAAAGILQSHSPSFLVVSSESPAIRAGSVGTTFGYTRGTTRSDRVIRSRPSGSLDSSEPTQMAKS